jgi:hypothetical protein
VDVEDVGLEVQVPAQRERAAAQQAEAREVVAAEPAGRIVEIRDDAGRVELRFADGAAVAWDRSMSFQSQIVSRNGRVTREAVAPKLAAAFTLYAVYPRLRDAMGRTLRDQGAEADPKKLDSLMRVRQDLDALQHPTVLADVSIGSLADFIRKVDEAWDSINRITWDQKGQRFLIA